MSGRIRRMQYGILAIVLAAILSPSAYAQDPIHKAGRGLVNLLTGWIELPKNIHLGTQEENPIIGIGLGLVKGTGLMLTRLAFGAYETVTFLIPYPPAYASPYEGLELPDYAWD